MARLCGCGGLAELKLRYKDMIGIAGILIDETNGAPSKRLAKVLYPLLSQLQDAK